MQSRLSPKSRHHSESLPNFHTGSSEAFRSVFRQPETPSIILSFTSTGSEAFLDKFHLVRQFFNPRFMLSVTNVLVRVPSRSPWSDLQVFQHWIVGQLYSEAPDPIQKSGHLTCTPVDLSTARAARTVYNAHFWVSNTQKCPESVPENPHPFPRRLHEQIV